MDDIEYGSTGPVTGIGVGETRGNWGGAIDLTLRHGLDSGVVGAPSFIFHMPEGDVI